MLRFVAFALRRARKMVRGLRQGLSEDERFLVADDVLHQLQQHGDPWAIADRDGKGAIRRRRWARTKPISPHGQM